MPTAAAQFDSAIKDAERLLAIFDAQPKPPSDDVEVLKRAGLVMALTAWETYVEDRLREAVDTKLGATKGVYPGTFLVARLEEEIRRLHNPDSEKTRKLFREYFDLEVTEGWKWNQMTPKQARAKLDEYIKTRGDIVHRSESLCVEGIKQPHKVTKDDLRKCINFLKELVKHTEVALTA